MSKSKEQLQQSVLDVGEQFAASMDTLLDTELRYLKYLRDRKRFHIGVRNIMSNGLGSGKFPDDPNPTPRRNPRGPRGFGGVGVPIPVPLFVPERVKEKQEDEKEKCDVPVPVIVPKKDKQDDGANDIKEFEREPAKDPALVPQAPLVPAESFAEYRSRTGHKDLPVDPISSGAGSVDVPDSGIAWDKVWDNTVDGAITAGEFINRFQLLPLTIGAGLIKYIFFGGGLGLGGAVYGSELGDKDLTSMYTQPTETIIGEDGAEIVLPVDELGDVIAMLYKDGAQVFIGTSQDFLSGLPSSPGKTAVLGDANRLAAIFGITDKGDGSSLSVGLESPITFSSTSTVEKEDLDLESIEKESLKEAAKSGGESRVAKRRKQRKTFDEVKAEIDAKELAKKQKKLNKRGSGAKPNPFSDASEQVKIPSDGNGNDRFGSPIVLNSSTENAWQKAVRAAAGDGVDLAAGVNSSFRSPEQQQQLLDLQDAGDPSVAQVAEIGASPHQQGWGIDLGLNTDAHKWMLINGNKFGFEWQGDGDPVHFNFVNNESNTKHLDELQPNNIQKDITPNPIEETNVKNVKKKVGATVGALGGLGMMGRGNITPPNTQTDKEIVSNQPVNQLDKNSDLIATQPSMIPVPISTTVAVPVPMAQKETKEIRRTLIIDTFDKGARVEVAYV